MGPSLSTKVRRTALSRLGRSQCVTIQHTPRAPANGSGKVSSHGTCPSNPVANLGGRTSEPTAAVASPSRLRHRTVLHRTRTPLRNNQILRRNRAQTLQILTKNHGLVRCVGS